MTEVLWRGSWTTRVRIVSGLILMLYLTLHLLNIAAVLISPAAFDAFQAARLRVTRSDVGTGIVGLALVAHMVLSLVRVVAARSLRMPLRDAVQIVLGLLIPLMLVDHLIYTRGAHEMLGVNTMLGYVDALIWGTRDGWAQAMLIIVAWVHGAIGLHMWLRLAPWWRAVAPWMLGVGVLVPALALTGFVSFARVMDGLLSTPRAQDLAHTVWNWPDADGFAALAAASQNGNLLVWAVLGTALFAFAARRGIAALRRPIRITYIDGPTIRAARGQTLLETSHTSGVPHTALCGGRGRCTTCRVIVQDGLDALPPPDPAEQRSLAAVGAPPHARLACQARPTGAVTVFRVFDGDGRQRRAHASQGKEARLAVLFLDMRGFTARTDGQLPYDVVFLLNRFFDRIVPPITHAGGTVDKYMGDGLMAVFETDDAAQSSRAALRAVDGIGRALEGFNTTLTREGSAPVAIGMGVHLGTVVLGEIGAAGQAPRTLIGDTVNIASRLEAETKNMGVQALISAAVLDAADVRPDPAALTALALRGRDAPLAALAVTDAASLAGVLHAMGAPLELA